MRKAALRIRSLYTFRNCSQNKESITHIALCSATKQDKETMPLSCCMRDLFFSLAFVFHVGKDDRVLGSAGRFGGSLAINQSDLYVLARI